MATRATKRLTRWRIVASMSCRSDLIVGAASGRESVLQGRERHLTFRHGSLRCALLPENKIPSHGLSHRS